MKYKPLVKSSVLGFLLSFSLICVGFAASGGGGGHVDGRADDRAEEVQSPPSEMRALVERYDADRTLLLRSERTPLSPAVLDRMQKF
jgi:hypothetical protein